jgi:hypothetical protein
MQRIDTVSTVWAKKICQVKNELFPYAYSTTIFILKNLLRSFGCTSIGDDRDKSTWDFFV